VADRTGLSVHALRFYEREGLLVHPVRRDTGGRRRYRPDDVGWIEICTKLRSSGMPVEEVRRFADLTRAGPGNEEERLAILRRHEQRVIDQLAELQSCLEVISWKAQFYDEHLSRGEAVGLWAPPTDDLAPA
jgi:DNA-binding transcriptional MerR regulator